MNDDTKTTVMPRFVEPHLTESDQCLDNQFADAFRDLKLSRLCREANFRKRSGYDLVHVLYLLLLMQWLKTPSIARFCRDSMPAFCDASYDVIYHFFKRPDFNWRRLQFWVTRQVYQLQELADDALRVRVIDDTFTARRGQKMEGVSRHYDHVRGFCHPGHGGASGLEFRERLSAHRR